MTSKSGSRTVVMKFGGTSVGSPAAMRAAAGIVRATRADWPGVVVVTSALTGVTSLLLEGAAAAVRGDMEIVTRAEGRLRQQHYELADALVADPGASARVKREIGLLIGEFMSLCHALAVLGEATPRALDAVAALGERMSVHLLAAAVELQNLPVQAVVATRLICTDDSHQNAHPDMASTTSWTQAVLGPILEAGRVPVVTGFIGATADGITTTLGRGGSDYSAAILGMALGADEVWIWTDVDGVMTADPRWVPSARTIPELSYREVAELAYFGAKVLHPKTILPVVEAGIGLRICNTFNPGHPGTRLVGDANGKGPTGSRPVLKAVTAIRKQRLITVEGRGMLGVPGVAARSFAAVASTGTSVPLISQASSEQSICFAVPDEAARRVQQAVEAAFVSELALRDIDRVWATEEAAIITVVGAGMIRVPGVAGKIFSALGDCGVNVIAIAQGSSEVSISMVVTAADTEAAVQAVHSLIVNGEA
ncbi:MAG: aspartate kinase [Anaerolineales bacterium]|nr:aspartate kinase [Anaerolineales bacterium]